MAHEGLHESESAIRPETIDRHRAIISIQEELEAVDWYDQRVDATSDESLKEVLGHNRDEEKEHASMTIEWLRRNDPVWDKHLRTYLFTSGSITGIETAAEPGGGSDDDSEPGLGIGSLRGEEIE